jgi:hypothetical protein
MVGVGADQQWGLQLVDVGGVELAATTLAIPPVRSKGCQVTAAP